MWIQIPDLALPLRTIFCIGRNYAEHAKELGNAVPTEPVVFLKPVSAVCYSGSSILIPKASNRVDHEVEIVVALKDGGKTLTSAQALQCIGGYGIGIDVTARDIQERLKQKVLPWAIAKGFDTFAVLGSFVPTSKVKNFDELSFQLKVNDVLKQKGCVKEMIFSIPELISYLSSIFTLSAGDIIFTGTPSGVGVLKAHDVVKAEMHCGSDVLASLQVSVKEAP